MEYSRSCGRTEGCAAVKAYMNFGRIASSRQRIKFIPMCGVIDNYCWSYVSEAPSSGLLALEIFNYMLGVDY